MATENKEDLIKKIAVLENEISIFHGKEKELKELRKEVLDLKKEKEEVIANEHNIRQQHEKIKNDLAVLQKTLDGKDKQIEGLKNDLTKLATLFDEYIIAYQDQVKMLGVFVKNTQTVEKFLSAKIDEFNGGNKK